MVKIQVENLNDKPISFDLTEEDLKAIKGGNSTLTPLSTSVKCPFPIRIYIIRIIAPPINLDS